MLFLGLGGRLPSSGLIDDATYESMAIKQGLYHLRAPRLAKWESVAFALDPL